MTLASLQCCLENRGHVGLQRPHVVLIFLLAGQKEKETTRETKTSVACFMAAVMEKYTFFKVFIAGVFCICLVIL